MPWRLTGPNYCCQTGTLAESLYLLGVTAPRRFALKDVIYVSTQLAGRRQEFSLHPRRPAYTVTICSWELRSAHNKLCGEFATLPLALENFSDWARATPRKQPAQRPALTVI